MPEPITPAASRRLPNVGGILLAQVRYQLRLLLRSPRAIGAGVTTIAWVTYGIGLVAAREAGVLKRWRATPLPPWCYFVGRITATVLVATSAAAVTVLIGVARYGTRLDTGAAVGLLVAVGLGALAWAASATAVTGVIPNVESASPILTLTYLSVILVSGTFGSLASEPHWLTTLASYLPAQPMIDAATRALQHVPGPPVLPGHDLFVLASWTVAGVVASLALFRWQPSRPAHRRTTKGLDRGRPATGERDHPVGGGVGSVEEANRPTAIGGRTTSSAGTTVRAAAGDGEALPGRGASLMRAGMGKERARQEEHGTHGVTTLGGKATNPGGARVRLHHHRRRQRGERGRSSLERGPVHQRPGARRRTAR